MKTKSLLIMLIVASLNNYGLLHAEIVEISNSGNTFTPDEITVAPGDTILFALGAYHDAVQVSKETWDANGTASNGGFSFPLGGGQLVLNEPGTYYYVCTPHASLGMKGIINVDVPSSITAYDGEDKLRMQVFPNPAAENITVVFEIGNTSGVIIELVDMTGRTLRTFVNGVYQPGKYSELFYLDRFHPGRYMIHLKTDSESRVEPLIIMD